MNDLNGYSESGNDLRQDEWDRLRLSLFIEVMELNVHGKLRNVWQNFQIALTSGFDRPLPVYPVYRKLRTFSVARWPLLKQIVKAAAHSPADIPELIKILQEIINVLEHAVDKSMRDQADKLEVEMDLLRTLLTTD